MIPLIPIFLGLYLLNRSDNTNTSATVAGAAVGAFDVVFVNFLLVGLVLWFGWKWLKR